MATMVEATTRGQTTATTNEPAPWYRDRTRLLAGAAIAVLILAVVGWVVWSSENRKEEFAARSLNQARTAAEAGNLPLASSELQRLIDTYGGTDAATEAVITTAPRSPSASGSPSDMAAALSRSTLNVPIRFTRITVSNGARAAAPFLPTVRSAQPMPAHETAKRRSSTVATAAST